MEEPLLISSLREQEAALLLENGGELDRNILKPFKTIYNGLQKAKSFLFLSERHDNFVQAHTTSSSCVSGLVHIAWQGPTAKWD